MNQLAAIQKKLMAIGCPHCFDTRLELRMRCDLGYQDVVYQASCERCHFSFEVNSGTRSLADLLPVISGGIHAMHCPHCGSDDNSMKMLCDIHSQDCFYLATCNECQKPFKALKRDVQVPEGLTPGRKSRFNIRGTQALNAPSPPEPAVPPSPAGILELFLAAR